MLTRALRMILVLRPIQTTRTNLMRLLSASLAYSTRTYAYCTCPSSSSPASSASPPVPVLLSTSLLPVSPAYEISSQLVSSLSDRTASYAAKISGESAPDMVRCCSSGMLGRNGGERERERGGRGGQSAVGGGRGQRREEGRNDAVVNGRAKLKGSLLFSYYKLFFPFSFTPSIFEAYVKLTPKCARNC
ncbi:hypothetical protein VTG60DRAFT_3275 [Thermothelomyces hinnuleus]